MTGLLSVAWIDRLFVDCFGLFHMVLTVLILRISSTVEATGIYDERDLVYRDWYYLQLIFIYIHIHSHLLYWIGLWVMAYAMFLLYYCLRCWCVSFRLCCCVVIITRRTYSSSAARTIFSPSTQYAVKYSSTTVSVVWFRKLSSLYYLS